MSKVRATATRVISCCIAISTLAIAHEHKAPHGGALIVLGDEFAHLELVLDARAGKLTAYVLDGEAERFVRVQQKQIALRLRLQDKKEEPLVVTLKAVSNVLTGEKEGDTAQFEGEAASLRGSVHFTGVIAMLAVRDAEFKDIQFRFPEGNEGGK